MDAYLVDILLIIQKMTSTNISNTNIKTIKVIDKIANETIKSIIKPKFNKKQTFKNYLYLYSYKSKVVTKKIILHKKNISIDNMLQEMYKDGLVAYKDKSIINSVYNQTIEAIINDIISNIPSIMYQQLRSNSAILQEVNTLFRNKAIDLIGSLDNVTENINKTYEEESDVELLNILRKIKPSSHITGTQYITAAVTKPVIIEMSKYPINRLPLIAYITNRLSSIEPSLLDKNSIVKHPGQIITAIKQTYFIDNKNWKTFLKMAPSILKHDNNYISILLHINQSKPSNSVTKLLKSTQLSTMMDNIQHGMNTLHINDNIAPEDKTVVAETYKNNYKALCALPAALYDTKVSDFNNFQYEVSDTIDYLNARYRETGLYPIHYTWNSYVKHTRDWHYLLRREQAIRNNGNRLHKWNTLLLDCVIDDYNVTALIDSPALVAEGQSMHHCVGTYWRSAIDNHYRFFHIEHKSNPKDAGTLCLTPNPYEETVKLQQLRGPYNAPVSTELQQVGYRILRRYQNMYKKTDTTLRVWNQTINHITNEVLHTVGYPERDVTKQEDLDPEDTEHDDND